MLPYLLLFIIVTFLFYLANKFRGKSNFFFYFLSFFSILILSFFAGCRDSTVGTDVWVYGKEVFLTAKYSNTLKQCLLYHYDIEYFYSFLNYISIKVIDDIGCALFLSQFIQTILVFLFFKRFITEVPIWLLMLCYCFLFYNVTLNLIRQGIAVAFVCYFSKFLFDRKIFLLLLSFIFCWFVHRSSAAVAILLLYVYFVMSNELKKQIKLIVMSLFLVICGFVLFGVLIDWLSQIDGFGKYAAYGTNSSFKSSVSIASVFTRVYFLIIVLISFFFAKYKDYKKRNYLILFLIFDFFALSLGMYTYYTSRLAMYFIILEIPFVFCIIYKSSFSVGTRSILIVCTVFVCFLNWYWINVLRGENATIPYTSEFLGL